MQRMCRERGVDFRFDIDVTRRAELLAPFDRLVFATGTRHRFGLGPLVRLLLTSGAARASPLRRLLSSPAVRDWFYHRARSASGGALRHLAHPGQKVVVIGDALAADKSPAAIQSAFDAALRAAPEVKTG
jgi:hypothetical protein